MKKARAHTQTHTHTGISAVINNTVRCSSPSIDRVSRIINLSSLHAGSAKERFNAGTVRDSLLAKILFARDLEEARTDSALRRMDRIADFLGTVRSQRPKLASFRKLRLSLGQIQPRCSLQAVIALIYAGQRQRARVRLHGTREMRKNRREHDNSRFVAFRQVQVIKRCLQQQQRRVRSDRYHRIVIFAVYTRTCTYIHTSTRREIHRVPCTGRLGPRTKDSGPFVADLTENSRHSAQQWTPSAIILRSSNSVFGKQPKLTSEGYNGAKTRRAVDIMQASVAEQKIFLFFFLSFSFFFLFAIFRSSSLSLIRYWLQRVIRCRLASR